MNTKPVALTPLSLPKTSERSVRDIVKEIVKKVGPSSTFFSVLTELKTNYPQVAFTENTVKQYVYSSRCELGFVTPRTHGEEKPTGEEIMSDLVKTNTLLKEMNMSGPKLLKLITQLEGFGDLAKLKKNLVALETIGGSAKLAQYLAALEELTS